MSGAYYARDGKVWKHPVQTKVEGGTRVEIGFPVCVMTEYVGVEAAEAVAELMNMGDAAPAMYEALRAADQFITNGIDLGFIRMPDADCPDPAHKTPGLIRSALALAEGGRRG